jgi:hypothetical protein
VIELRIEKLIAECDMHLRRIGRAYGKMSDFMPLNAATYRHLTDENIECIDQFLFRFAKLQDAMGEKLFLLLLEFLQEENIKNRLFVDILNRLEQLGVLDDKNVWLELRKIRNSIAHQYEDEPQQASEALNAIYAVKPRLEEIYARVKSCYRARAR